ncbi:CLUMA_CG008262, isoform A [Clunio marinus]|uniref:CLUMA_CG008262, isoform A n=1 Tax=Clunio marinus TaxID=568069 RepID=A0A1J1I386_9DIPT|nr:CLUMA_CG008262, isoform A [Clunio marinus]
MEKKFSGFYFSLKSKVYLVKSSNESCNKTTFCKYKKILIQLEFAASSKIIANTFIIRSGPKGTHKNIYFQKQILK